MNLAMHKRTDKITALLIALVILSSTAALVQAAAEQLDLAPREVVYKHAGGEDIAFDIYKDPLATNMPVVVFIHGGSWVRGGKRDEPLILMEAARELAGRGFAFVSIGYRLADDKTKFPIPVEDVKDAIRFLRKNADELGIDADRIGLLGISAGGHLALTAGLTPDNAFVGDKNLSSYSSRVRTIISWAGPADLTVPDESAPNAKPLVEYFMGGTQSDKPELYREASPVMYLNAHSPSMLLIYSDKDSVVPYSQAKRLLDKAAELGVDAKLLTIKNSNHVYWPVGLKMVDPDIATLLSTIVSHIQDQLGPE